MADTCTRHQQASGYGNLYQRFTQRCSSSSAYLPAAVTAGCIMSGLHARIHSSPTQEREHTVKCTKTITVPQIANFPTHTWYLECIRCVHTIDCIKRWTNCSPFPSIIQEWSQNIPDRNAAILRIWSKSLHSSYWGGGGVGATVEMSHWHMGSINR